MKTPSTSEYKAALEKVYFSAPVGHQKMLAAHYRAENHAITATELAASADYETYNAANLQYGIFCRRLCDELQYEAPIGASGDPTPTFVIATGSQGSKAAHWTWVMRPEVVAAIQALSLFPGDSELLDSAVHADEVGDDKVFIEGAVRQVLINAFERDLDARASCLDYWGLSCVVCEFNFEERYGAIGAGYIHVHHLVPLATIGHEYSIDPIKDLRPVCPNCHAMLHRTKEPMSIDKLRGLIRGRLIHE